MPWSTGASSSPGWWATRSSSAGWSTTASSFLSLTWRSAELQYFLDLRTGGVRQYRRSAFAGDAEDFELTEEEADEGLAEGYLVRVEALDVIRMAHRNDYDVAVVFSQDEDPSEVAEEIRVSSAPGCDRQRPRTACYVRR